MQAIKAKDSHAYDKWNAAHKCSLNYKGSSLAMEEVGAEKIFKQSVTKHSLHYTFFYGNGDSKAFPVVENAYGPEKPVKKYECIGHYRKSWDTSLKEKNDVKELSGKGRLTDAKIDTLQNYFGIALRQNAGGIDVSYCCLS